MLFFIFRQDLQDFSGLILFFLNSRMELRKPNPPAAENFYIYSGFTLSLYCDFHFCSPEAIGVWPLSSGEWPKKKIQLIL
jgi:hypothetical protein